MRKYLIISVLLIAFNLSSQSQKINTDSLRIISLKNQLSYLKDSARADCLIDIASEYNAMHNQNDSMQKYTNIAYELSTKIGYKSGIAMSLMGLKTKTDSERNENMRKAIQIAEEISDYKILGWASYMGYPDVKLSQSENLKKSSAYFQKAGDEEDEADIDTWLGAVLIYEGKYEEAFPYCERAVMLSKKKRTHHISLGPVLVQFSLKNISNLYMVAGDYETALEYLRKSQQYSIENHQDWNWHVEIGSLYNKTGLYDSALYYFQKNLEANPGKPQAKIPFGETYLLKKDYDKAIKSFEEAIDSTIKPKITPGFWNDKGLMGALLYMAKAYAGKKNYPTALKYVNQSDYWRVARGFSSTEFLMDRYNLLSTIYHHLHKNDSAYNNLKMYIALKDSLDNKKAIWRLNLKLSTYKSAVINAKKEAQLALLDKDNKIKEQQLKQEATFRNLLVSVFIALIFTGIFVFRNLSLKRKNEKLKQEQAEKEWAFQKIESEKKQAELHHRAAELEMQALRAQMNPHFIFNCLSSINRIIMKNDSHAASDYLTRFSRLMRLVLINSQRAMIPLEDELQMLRLYLDMERLRFKDSFEYKIIFTNTIDEGAVQLPPLLLQPFCENAIWHGLMQKDGPGLLAIELSMQDNVLNCMITDNGIGREKAEEIKSKTAENQKSMGLKITKERLALLNREKGLQTYFEIEDLKDEMGNASGTRVDLKISYKETFEEIA